MIDKNLILETDYGQLKDFEGNARAACIDTRILKPGEIFFALKGENSDGHNYISAAFEKGASLCTVNKDWYETNRERFMGKPFWIVDDPLKALQKLAASYRKRFDIPVIAITGTSGKTTTRKMITETLKSAYKVHSTMGNYNNHIGMPLSLLNLNTTHQISVMEIGTNHFGEIKFLCDILKPTHGLITNIGYGHMEFFKSKEGVAKEKGDLFKSLPSDGIAFVNLNDPFISKMETKAKRITYSLNSKKADFSARIVKFDENALPLMKINNKFELKLKMPGKFSAINALAAFAVCSSFKVNTEYIKNTLESFSGEKQRFKIFSVGNIKIIDDTYNANLDSTISAIETLNMMKSNGKKVMVFGDMLELGEFSKKAHEIVGEKVVKSGINRLFCWGKNTIHTFRRALELGFGNSHHFDDKSELAKKLKKELSDGDIVLVKGSRGSKMEQVIEEIKG